MKLATRGLALPSTLPFIHMIPPLFARLLPALALVAAAWPHALMAQGGARPTAEQATAMLQARPELVAQLRQRLMTSGMSPEQVRARLKAEGYPENLLDAYLAGGTGGAAP